MAPFSSLIASRNFFHSPPVQALPAAADLPSALFGLVDCFHGFHRLMAIRLGYAVQGQDASQTIRTTTTPCRYGGARTWFQCSCCSGRAVVLFMRAGRFACRQWQKVSYASQSGSTHDRAITRYHQLHALIEAGKPKWQRWTTFERLEDRFERVSEQVNRSLMTLIQRLQARR